MPSADPMLPPSSAIQRILDSQPSDSSKPVHPAYLHHLAAVVLYNLQYQHDWTSLTIHTHSTLTDMPLPRPVVSGLPPKRTYIHPDEQVEILKAEHDTQQPIVQVPEREWVLPTHLEEKWSLAQFASIFDALETVPSGESAGEMDESTVGARWRGKNRQKRIILATLHDDSTVVYYIMHDGIVKPRQN